MWFRRDEYDKGLLFHQYIALMSGLSSRTIRNYISSGILKGDKVDGCWQFTAEQTNTFFEHPGVFRSIQAKRNGIIFAFLADRKHKHNQICTILDLPEEKGKDISAFFTNLYNTGEFGNKLEFYFEDIAGYPRVILKGQSCSVMKILNLFYQRYNTEGGIHEV